MCDTVLVHFFDDHVYVRMPRCQSRVNYPCLADWKTITEYTLRYTFNTFDERIIPVFECYLKTSVECKQINNEIMYMV